MLLADNSKNCTSLNSRALSCIDAKHLTIARSVNVIFHFHSFQYADSPTRLNSITYSYLDVKDSTRHWSCYLCAICNRCSGWSWSSRSGSNRGCGYRSSCGTSADFFNCNVISFSVYCNIISFHLKKPP